MLSLRSSHLKIFWILHADVPGSDLAGAAVVRKGRNEILVSSVGSKYLEQW